MFNTLEEIENFLKEYKVIEWETSKKIKDENGKEKTILGYPKYDKRVVELIKFINEKYKIDNEKYIKFIEEKWYDWEIEDLEMERLPYLVFYIYQTERFCDGLIGKNIEDGTLLKIIRQMIKYEK